MKWKVMENACVVVRVSVGVVKESVGKVVSDSAGVVVSENAGEEVKVNAKGDRILAGGAEKVRMVTLVVAEVIRVLN